MILIDRTLILLLASNALASVGVGVAMIAVPWILASQIDDGILFGVLITAANVVLAIVAPWTGVFIDSTVRRKFMIGLRITFIAGLGGVFFLSASGSGTTAALILYYILGATFYAINIPLRTAFVQELYEGGAYARVNSILEIENQVAAVVTGMVAILLIERCGLPVLAIGNAVLLLIAILCIAFIRHQDREPRAVRGTPLQDIRDGFAIIRRDVSLSVVLLVATLPYVVVILYTYLHPIALSQLLALGGDQYALVEVLFAIGAIVGGAALLRRDVAADRIVPLIRGLIGLFALVAVAQAIFPIHGAFLLIAVLFGLLNAAVRILRQTLLMERAAPHEIGRIGAFLQSWIMLMRALFLGLLALTVAGVGIVPALWVAAVLPALGWFALRASVIENVNLYEPKEMTT